MTTPNARSRSVLSALAALAGLLAAPAVAAPVAGPWHVSGTIGDTPFAIDCKFEPRGADLGGVCVDASKGTPQARPGKAYTLTKGRVAGNEVRWAYPASFMLAKFEVSFAGTLSGERMSGTVSASGRKGAFTAVKK